MQLWEIVVAAVGAALVALLIYLIIAVKKMFVTMDKINKIMDDNEGSIRSIVQNVDGISGDARGIVNKVENVVTRADKLASNIKKEGNNSILSGLGGVTDLFGVAYTGYKFLKKSREKRKLKKLLKESK